MKYFLIVLVVLILSGCTANDRGYGNYVLFDIYQGGVKITSECFSRHHRRSGHGAGGIYYIETNVPCVKE